MSDHKINIEAEDCDIELIFPSGEIIEIQCRPSNADVNYNGSLDIILPKDQLITTWKGDDMEDSMAVNSKRQHERITKQIVLELPL